MKMNNTEVDLLDIEHDSTSLDMDNIYSMGSPTDSCKNNDFLLADDDEDDDDDDDDDSNHGGSSFQKQVDNPKSESKARYKHVPHREKPVQVVARRNARERRRVQTVNSAFTSLRKHIPYENRHKRLSKVKTLRIAIDYINELQKMLSSHDNLFEGLVAGSHMSTSEMLQTTLEAAQAQCQSQMAPMQHLQDLHSLPLSATQEMPMTSVHHMPVTSIPTSLFTGTGSLIDLMSSSNMHHHQLQNPTDWSNQAKEMQDFLHMTE